MQGRFRAVRAALVGGSVALLALAVLAPSAGAGEGPAAPLTIVKTVSGPVPEGTTFVARLRCETAIIDNDGVTTNTVYVTFDDEGQPTGPDTFGFNSAGSCTVTETDDGGAATTTYECEGTLPEEKDIGDSAIIDPLDPVCPEAGPQADPITVNIETPGQTATVTINNTFVAAPTTTTTAPPQPAASPAVVARPTFTG